jgi:transcriptional regulator with XRE-family HTH domain
MNLIFDLANGRVSNMEKDALKKFRESIGFTQSDLAEALSVANNTISRWELGTRAIPEFLPLALETIERRQTAGLLPAEKPQKPVAVPETVKGESVKGTTETPVRVAKTATATQSAESRRRERLPTLSGGDKWLSLVEAGEMLGKKRKSVNDDVNKRRLPANKIDEQNFVKESDVIAFRDSRSG